MTEQQKQELTDKFNNLENGSRAFYEVHDEPNKELWLKNTLELPYDEAYVKIQQLEIKDQEISSDPEKIYNDYIKARNAEYEKRGVTRDAIMEAAWERDMEGRPEKADELQAIRMEVKALIPKPE